MLNTGFSINFQTSENDFGIFLLVVLKIEFNNLVSIVDFTSSFFNTILKKRNNYSYLNNYIKVKHYILVNK